MSTGAGTDVIGLACALRDAAAAAAAPPQTPAELVARLAALGDAAHAVFAAVPTRGPIAEPIRSRVIEEVRAARMALARCRRTRLAVGDLASMFGGVSYGSDGYGSDGVLAPPAAATGVVRHV